jgi:aryl-alcohol dehydrogenase-like predicted oxidoreductase
MQFGEALDAPASHRLLSAAADRGVTSFDVAEMYPVPPTAATAGASERILGAWLAKCPLPRDALTIITKVAGPGSMEWVRGGPAALDGAALTAALDGSLARLGTDCVDCLLLHWPDR